MNEMYVTTIENVDSERHKSPIIIHDGWQYYFAEFNNWEQLEAFLDLAGLKITLEEEKQWVFKPTCGKWRKYAVNRKLDNACNGGFWSLSEIPKGAKKIKGHSNGRIVDCYILNDGETLHIYRPCLLYTSPSPRDPKTSRKPSSA